MNTKMRKNVVSVLLSFLLFSLVGFDANASDFPYGMSEEEAWRIVDSVRSEQFWMDYMPVTEQITPLIYAKSVGYEGSDVLIVFFGLPGNKTTNIRVNLSNRTGEFNTDAHSPSVEEVKNFFDTSFVSDKFRDCLPGDTLTPLRLYYAGSGSSSDYLKRPGVYWSTYNWADFTEYVYHLRDRRVRKKCEMQLEYKRMIDALKKASGGKWGEQ